jgi:hypothetical protein
MIHLQWIRLIFPLGRERGEITGVTKNERKNRLSGGYPSVHGLKSGTRALA